MKRLLIVLFTMFALTSFSQDNLKYSNWVNDYADVLTTEQENILNKKIGDFEKETEIEFAIVTVKSLEGRSVEGFTYDLAERWGVGKKGKDNGLMILIAPNERKWRIEVGYGLEEYLTDGYTKVEAEKLFPKNFKKGDYFAGIDPLVDKFQDRLGTMTWEERQADIERKKQEEAEAKAAFLNVLKWIGLSILGIIFIVVVVRLRRRARERAEELRRRIKSVNNKINIDANHFKRTLDKVKKLEPTNSDITKWEKTEQKVDTIVKSSSTAKGLEFVQNKSSELIGLTSLGLAAMAIVIKKHDDFDEIKSYVDNNHLGRSIKNIQNSIKRFKVKNDKGDYSIDWSDVGVLSNIDYSKKYFDKLKNNLDINNIDSLRKNYKKCQSLVDNSVNTILSYEDKLQRYYNAKSSINSGINNIPDLIKKMDKKCKDSDVSSSTRRKAKDVKVKAGKYKPNYTQSSVISSWNTLDSIISEIKSIIRRAQSDIDEEERKRRRRRRSSSSSSVGYGLGGFSSGSSSGGGFGGFGGGSFGGGGSSGSW